MPLLNARQRCTLLFLATLTFSAGCTETPKPSNGNSQLWQPDAQGVLKIDITGDDFRWHIRYPGSDGELASDDDILARRHLHIPLGTKIRLRLLSRDYVYTLNLPDFTIREIAVPDLEFFLEFQVDKAGTYELRCDQMCGNTQMNMNGTLVVESPREFNRWLAERRASPP